MDPIEQADARENDTSNNNASNDSAPSAASVGQQFYVTPRALSGHHTPRRPSIRLMRLPTTQRLALHPATAGSEICLDAGQGAVQTGRRRSRSEPQRRPLNYSIEDGAARYSPMSPVSEETSRQPSHPGPPSGLVESAQPVAGVILRPIENSQNTGPPRQGRIGRMSTGARSMFGLNRVATHSGTINMPSLPQGEYEAEVVNLLDVVDPEISTITTLTNVQNSLFIPDLGTWINRRPAYTVTPDPGQGNAEIENGKAFEKQEPLKDGVRPAAERTGTMDTITSHLSDSRFAVLPDGVSLDGWGAEDKRALNDHVRHMLHSRRSAFKRGLKGFIQYVKKPLGFLVTLYATLITLFGLAWVLFLIGWINVGGKQLYVINVIDYVLVALFAIVGDGLAPFRAIDTYHMIYIAHYYHLTYKLRRKQHLPKLRNKNDLPERHEGKVSQDVDVERTGDAPNDEDTTEFSVLSIKQQEKLTHHTTKFAKSHTFYKPHETTTHYAFPLRILIAVVILLDFHSLFQISLGAVTWGIHYTRRPFALTTVILCCSLSCNFAAGLLIWIGDRRTRKKDVIERMFRQELTEQAITKLKKEKSKRKECEEEEKETKNRDTENTGEQVKGSKEKDIFL
ncbi:hypothetical protein LOZ12_005718 [Ophidiomyces ophidiicola]|nr:hypothetical protein LOZ62_005900 [Ophidiomyces ophidiicola]KAI2043007.1 hypothetical protein LOZ44_005701 [Ophidiomyces ophidiicola]KAI2045562.1 hypothetical protein LOZ38_005818 [Ophidiomyces ophidiicola]KAI2090390.1 hypothetical protein LOZ35_005236 [Ophidiomyces ophidiicola]KAI2091829.1 hypothetical protein LOZ33_005385 [Ophidiomyces ophidiicola]